MNTVIYARYSSSNQREESIEGQLRVCHEYARHHGYKVIDEYCDRAISGRTDRRPAFQQMIKDSEKRVFQVVIVYTIDRFARNRYDSATYKSKLKKNGVSLVSATQPMSDGPEAIILESVMEGFAEYYSENLSRNVKRGLQENALSGKSLGSRCLGYRVQDGQYVKDELEAKAVHLIFELYDRDFGKQEILDRLNGDGYKTAYGKNFNMSGLDRILANEKYKGVYNYAGMYVEGGMPQIVETELFDRVQEKREMRKRMRARKKAAEDYLLSGKLFCGHCGKMMIGESGTSRHGEVYRYYKCQTRKRKTGSCQKHTERKEPLERAVLSLIYEDVLTDENIEMIATKSFAILEEESQDKVKLVSYMEEHKQIMTKIENVLSAIEQGIFTNSTKSRLEALESRKDELETLIVKEQMKKPAFTKEHIIYYLEQMREGNVADPEYQRQLVDAFVNSIFVYDDDGEDGKGTKIVVALKSNETRTRMLTMQDVSDIASVALPCNQHPNIIIRKNLIFVLVKYKSLL